MATITFTTKKHKPTGGRFVSMNLDPISVEVKRVSFPTNGGDKVVSRIFFFPNSAIKQEDIKKKLGMKGEEVPALTFEIEIGEIKAEDPSKGPSLTASHSASMWKEPSGNEWKEGKLFLRDYSLDKIKQTSEQGGDEDDDDTNLTFTCPQCNKEAPTSSAIEHNGTKYCSAACRDKAHPQQKECPQCHKKFANLPVSGSQGKSYCGDKCKQAAEESDEPEEDNPTPDPQQQFDQAERERTAKAVQNKQELNSLIEKGKGQEKVDELKTTLDQIEQKSSTQAYQELKGEIDNLHQKLDSKLTMEQKRERKIDQLNELLTRNNLKKEDLPGEVKTKLDNLKNLTDLTQITSQEVELKQAIGTKGASKKFEAVFSQVETLGANDNSEKAELKAKLEKLLGSDDEFVQSYVKTHRSQIENALSKLASKKQKQPNSPNNQQSGLSTGQKVAIGIGVIGGTVILIGLVIFLVRKKKNSHHSAK